GRVLQATQNVMEKARDLTSKRIDRLIESGDLDRLAESALAGGAEASPPPPMPGGSSGTPPEPSASIPAP
ncbi:MAG TPA: hypothetical protein PLG36_10250, partial [Trueperaceae bacterium]|nr:hypothetical protein [Trueperaceae bacterium]